MNTVKQATFRFYADLNDFLPRDKQQKPFPCRTYGGDQTVKHLIESLGIPHTEVDLILVDGRPVGFNHIACPEEQISVYPPFSMLDMPQEMRLQPPPSDPVKFLLDNHLGRLARYLRLFGFDTLYFNNELDDKQLASLSSKEQRILLSRDRGLLKRKPVVYGYCLRTKDPYEQLRAVIHRYRLAKQISPWQRCLRCNGDLHSVPKEAIIKRLEPKTKLYFHEFQQCSSCQQVYWRGSHFTKLQAAIDQILDEFQHLT